MKKWILLFLFLLSISGLRGQGKTMSEGKISYITLQNIYVRFENSGMVQVGDSIFIRKDQKLIPLLIAESVSSTSCVGKPLFQSEFKVADIVYIRNRIAEKPVIATKAETTMQQDSIQIKNDQKLPELAEDPQREQRIRGRLAASSYSGFSNSSDFNQRMRYTFSLTADHISGSKFSTDSYILFTHKANHWSEVKENIFSALKIYSLSVKYDLNEKSNIIIGRKINPRISSIGAIDGLQAETSVKNFTFGAVAGFNPDYTDYSFNPKLFEYGAFLSHDSKNKNGEMVNSFAFFQQTNSGKTDRRFAYFQQDNSLVKNLNLFFSTEIDLYALKDSIPTGTLSLTSLYISMRYKFSGKLSVFASYDARKNVIYYETFKNYLDQLLEDATRQGYQFRVNYNPTKSIYSGISGGYRFRKTDLHPMLNANGFLNFPQVPWVNTSVNLTVNWMKSSYVDGMIYGVRLNRDIIPSKLSTGINYRFVDYTYPSTTNSSIQHMAELELFWQMSKKLSFSINYDGNLDKSNLYNSLYLNLVKRF